MATSIDIQNQAWSGRISEGQGKEDIAKPEHVRAQ